MDGARVPGVRTKETNLGDFVADAYLWQGKKAQVLSGTVDAAIVNGGSLRYSLNKGTITKGSLQQILPYNNQLYIMKLKGSKILEILESATCVSPLPIGAFPQVSGIRYIINPYVSYAKGNKYDGSEYYAPAKPGSRVTIEEIAGKPFDAERIYAVIMTEFQYNGGASYGGLRELARNAQSIGYLDVEAVENYLKSELHGQVGEQYSKSANRIRYSKK